MDQEAPDELSRGEPHDLLPLSRFDAVIFPTECDGIGIRANQTAVGDGDPLSGYCYAIPCRAMDVYIG